MKQTFFLILLTLSIVPKLFAQITIEYHAEKLETGYPPELENNFINSKYHNFKYAELPTENDSIEIFFGTAQRGTSDFFWSSVHTKNTTSNSFTHPIRIDSLKKFVNVIERKMDKSSWKFSFEVHKAFQSDSIKYIWLNNNEKSRLFSVIKIDKPIQKNKQFPVLSFQLLNGKNLLSEDFIGKCVIINWWATNCSPCRAEIPGLNTLVDKYAENPNVIFLAIAHDKKEKLNRFLATNEFKFSQAISTKEHLEIFGNSYPKHVVVNPKGKVSFYMEGGFAEIYKLIDMEIGKVIDK